MKKIDINIINEWPQSWAGFPEDVKYGQKLLDLFRPFIESLIDSTYSKRTIKNHIDNLWVLGGYVIKEINEDEELVKQEPKFLLTKYIDSWDGPMIHDLSRSEQKSFDRTCKYFYNYLVLNVLSKSLNRSSADF